MDEQMNVLEYLEYSAKSYPQKTAVVDGDNFLSYEKLENKSKKYGDYIAGISAPRLPIVVFMDKSIDTLCAMFGSAYAGCFYVPVNPEQPEDRIQKILDVLQSPLILTNYKLKERVLALEFHGKVVCVEDLYEQGIINDEVYEMNPSILEERRQQASSSDPLYGIFTSGSTGTPKCIIVNHKCVLDFIGHFTETFGITETDVIGNQAPFDFDVSVKDIYSAMKTGATLVLIQKELFALPPGLLDYLCDKKVTVLIWAVSALCQISGLHGFDYKVPTDIHTVMFSGEKMPMKQLGIWQEALPDTRFVNLYGPTEITCNCTYYVINHKCSMDEKLPIGKAFEGRSVFLLDENKKVINESNCPGEICCCGESVTDGYYKDEEQTNQKFILFDYNGKKQRTYCTGDLAYYNEDGNLIFEGRKDFQIKHMGHRIELEEIETAISNLESVTRGCCIFDRKRNKITAFYVGNVSPTELRKELKEKLPVYMVPQKINQVEQIPLTKNGKMDRKYFSQLLEAE